MPRNERRGVEDLRQNAERTRAELAGTVDQLRSKVSETVTDIQHRISPDAIKAGVGEYVRNRGDVLMEKAKQNPLATAAIAAGLAYPLFGLVRSIPGPVFLIGSGLFLMGSPAGQKVNAATKALAGSAIEKANVAGDGLRQAGVFASDRLSQVGEAMRRSSTDSASQIAGAAVGLTGAVSTSLDNLPQQASDAAAGAARAIRDTAASATDSVRSAAHSAVEYSADAANRLKAGAMEAPRRLSDSLNQAMQQNPVLIGSLALGAGMLLASMVPRSNIERSLAGGVADAARFGAAGLAAQGLEAAKSAASEIFSEVVEGARKEGSGARGPLGAGNSIRSTVQKVAENATDAGLEPIQHNDAD